jgi:hypothetical protein
MIPFRLVILAALSLGLAANGIAASPAKPTPHDNTPLSAQQQAAADTCKTYVSFRLGSLLSLHITEVSVPKPPANRWLVIGEDKSKTPAVSFICHLLPRNQGWELEKLELLQLAEPAVEQSAAASRPRSVH